ncbi:MAG: YceG family protein [Filifactor alocis]|nr:YceG family protein [Filifactor alocis]
MFEHQNITKLNDFFENMNDRQPKGVYFYRINGYNEEIAEFIRRYYETARRRGVIIEGRIPNPDEKNLAYYNEIMGSAFYLKINFISENLKKWLPRMDDRQRSNVASSMYRTLSDLKLAGKNDNMIKNAYVKFMCWLYYKFERIVNQLGTDEIPKILYEGEIGRYELLLISILCGAGCDVVLLQYRGDAAYLKSDPTSAMSISLSLPEMKPFPPHFNLRYIMKMIQEELNMERLYGKKPQFINCTNASIEGNSLEDFKKPPAMRGKDKDFYYNCYCRIRGVEDKLTYVNDLYRFYLELKNEGRLITVVNRKIEPPSMQEISSIKRKNYSTLEQMLADLSTNLQYSANPELQRIMVKAFVDVLFAESKMEDMNVNKLTNRAVYLLCWLKRYQGSLFSNWKMPEIGVFIYMGGCKNETEAMFMRFLSKLPVDVLILQPNLNQPCRLEDKFLYEINHLTSLAVTNFPTEHSEVQVGTAAYHAERELDTLLYQDSGIFRDHQYTKANSVNLQTMYEEIKILWKEELKYRPNFSVVDDIVNLPVIFSKVAGVKDGDVQRYWASIKELLTEDTLVVRRGPYVDVSKPNPIKARSVDFWKYNRLQKSKIKADPDYPYRVLREDVQDHILDKLQLLIESKVIRGTFENGMEYKIIATVLHLDKEVVRMIQRFDFTKTNPKLIYFNTGEELITIEDSILATFLNLVGFDVVFFVPTGYQSIEGHFNKKIMEEHQIGTYVYDLEVPDLKTVSTPSRPKSWRERLFGRGV